MLELVVARYKEDISWINEINSRIKINVYNKFYKENPILPNVGREAHTYLHYIIDKYYGLAEYTIFCQGNPVFHEQNFIQQINEFYNNSQLSPKYFGLPIEEKVNSITESPHINGLPIYYFIELLFGIKCDTNTKISFNAGAQFIIPKRNILNRPLDFYKFLYKFVSYDSTSLEPWIFERLWPMIFNTDIEISSKYKLFI